MQLLTSRDKPVKQKTKANVFIDVYSRFHNNEPNENLWLQFGIERDEPNFDCKSFYDYKPNS